MFVADVGNGRKIAAARQFIKYKNTKYRAECAMQKQSEEGKGKKKKEKQKSCAHKNIWTKPFRILSDLFKRMECSANDLVDAAAAAAAFPSQCEHAPATRSLRAEMRIVQSNFICFLHSVDVALQRCDQRAIANILNVLDSCSWCRRRRRRRHRYRRA